MVVPEEMTTVEIVAVGEEYVAACRCSHIIVFILIISLSIILITSLSVLSSKCISHASK